MDVKIKQVIKAPLVWIYKTGLRLFGGRGLHKVWPLGAIRDFLSTVSRTYGRPASVVFRGKTIFLDPNDSSELSVWGDHHPASHEIELIKHLLKSGETGIDVGAHIGLITLFMADAAGREGHVFAFEPEPNNVQLLEKNVAANALSNVTVTPAAVFHKTGIIKLYLSDFNPGDHRIYNPAEKVKDWEKNDAVYDKLVSGKRSAIDVSTISLDDFFRDYDKPITFIKMDVQGAEGAVVQGMMGLLAKYQNIKILTEFWPAGLAMFGIDANTFLTNLERLGLSFYETEAYVSKKSISKEVLLRTYTVLNNRTSNLVISRQAFTP